MTTFISNLLGTVLRPSMAALGIAVAVGIASWDNDAQFNAANGVDITDWSCSGLFRPICQAF
ncbi:MAG: hypothetical protein OXC60_07680 [Litoreibacter sp.]|nr:hypothetical protein [Litoreibacter sp.]